MGCGDLAFRGLDFQKGRVYSFRMNLPNLLTISRIILAPVFFLLLFVPVWTGGGFLPCYAIAWVVFFYIEISDVVDGHLA